LHDSGHRSNEGLFGEAHGDTPADLFPDRLHKDGEGMAAMRLLPEAGNLSWFWEGKLSVAMKMSQIFIFAQAGVS